MPATPYGSGAFETELYIESTLPDTSTAIPSSCISRWMLNLRDVDMYNVQNIDWELLQTALLQFDPLPILAIECNIVHAFRWLVKAVAAGSILQSLCAPACSS